MLKTSVRAVLVAAACLAVTGAVRPAVESSLPLAISSTSTTDGQQGSEVLMTNSGYMVAIG